MQKLFINKTRNHKSGQSIVEYCVLFAVVVGVIIISSLTVIGPALNSLYNRASDSLAHINTEIP